MGWRKVFREREHQEAIWDNRRTGNRSLKQRKCFRKGQWYWKSFIVVIYSLSSLLGFFYQYFLSVRVPSIIFQDPWKLIFSFLSCRTFQQKSKSNMYDNIRINHETTVLRLNSMTLRAPLTVSLFHYPKACPESWGKHASWSFPSFTFAALNILMCHLSWMNYWHFPFLPKMCFPHLEISQLT